MADFTRRDLDDILQAHLQPIRETIIKLESAQGRIIEILAQQARMDEKINSLEKETSKCTSEHDGIYKRLREAENKTADKLWQFIFIIISAMLSYFIGKMS